MKCEVHVCDEQSHKYHLFSIILSFKRENKVNWCGDDISGMTVDKYSPKGIQNMTPAQLGMTSIVEPHKVEFTSQRETKE